MDILFPGWEMPETGFSAQNRKMRVWPPAFWIAKWAALFIEALQDGNFAGEKALSFGNWGLKSGGHNGILSLAGVFQRNRAA
jgi:hypothetical protein